MRLTLFVVCLLVAVVSEIGVIGETKDRGLRYALTALAGVALVVAYGVAR